MEDDKLDPENFENALKDVLNTLGDLASKERRKQERYKDLFELDDIGGLRRLETDMTKAILDFCQAREDRTGKKITNKQYAVLRMLPRVIDELREIFTLKEGISCCVDKAFWAVAKFLEQEDEQ